MAGAIEIAAWRSLCASLKKLYWEREADNENRQRGKAVLKKMKLWREEDCIWLRFFCALIADAASSSV